MIRGFDHELFYRDSFTIEDGTRCNMDRIGEEFRYVGRHGT